MRGRFVGLGLGALGLCSWALFALLSRRTSYLGQSLYEEVTLGEMEDDGAEEGDKLMPVLRRATSNNLLSLSALTDEVGEASIAPTVIEGDTSTVVSATVIEGDALSAVSSTVVESVLPSSLSANLRFVADKFMVDKYGPRPSKVQHQLQALDEEHLLD
jgi:hypothetical protein